MEKISYVKAFWRAFKEFLENSSIHGFSFIIQPNRHWIERIFWIICCILAWTGSIMLILASWYDYQNNSISFVPDTTYLDWNTGFPSVTVCETKVNKETALSVLKGNPKINNTKFSFSILKVLYSFIDLRTGDSYLKHCLQKVPKSYQPVTSEDCPKENLDTFVRQIRSPCEDIFKTCTWNDMKFNCCQYFLPLDTEFGMCYSINNIQTRDATKPGAFLDMNSNRTTGPGRLILEFNMEVEAYFTSKADVPNFNSNKMKVSISNNEHSMLVLAITEVHNEPGVESISISKRKCKFINENEGMSFYGYYSSSACEIECVRNKMNSICNCTSPSLSKGVNTCNLEGVLCLMKKQPEIAMLISEWDQRKGLVCSCMQSCEGMHIVDIFKKAIGKKGPTMLEIRLANLPTVRFIRQIVRGKLDMVVNLGGTAGLFVGASLLSLVEVLFFLFVRPIWERIRTDSSSSQSNPSEPHIGSTYEKSLPIREQLSLTKKN